MNNNLVEEIKSKACDKGLVILAGAGVSMDEPASLPGWFELNGMILESVNNRFCSYLERENYLDKVFKNLIDRRDKSGKFPPDYQAQIIEEQCGETYFHALKSLDLEQCNFSHEAIATLTSAGYVRAIVTTNFDCLIEHALRLNKTKHDTYYNKTGFQKLANMLVEGNIGTTIPIVKIHGTVKNVGSMIDTLKQRLQGRGPALQLVLDYFLCKYYWLYCGFSGADLDYDPNYLGLRNAALKSPGFSFLVRPKDKIRPSVKALKKEYGSKAKFARATLKDFFSEILKALSIDLPETPPTIINNPKQEVRKAVDNWANNLNPMETTNIIAGLFEAGEQEAAAFEVLHRMWKDRIPRDCHGPDYSRFQYNYGRLCLLRGELTYEETSQNLFRSMRSMPEAEALAGLYYTYKGHPFSEIINFPKNSLQYQNKYSPTAYADYVLAFAKYADIYGKWEQALPLILQTIDLMNDNGDEPRRAKLLSRAALCTARMGKVDQSLYYFDKGEPAARYLGDERIIAEFYFAQGVAMLSEGQPFSALHNLSKASAIFATKQRQRIPDLLPLYLEWMKASYEEGKNEEVMKSFDQAQKLLSYIPAYWPHLGLTTGIIFLREKNLGKAKEHLAGALSTAEQTGNDWIIKQVNDSLKTII